VAGQLVAEHYVHVLVTFEVHEAHVLLAGGLHEFIVHLQSFGGYFHGCYFLAPRHLMQQMRHLGKDVGPSARYWPDIVLEVLDNRLQWLVQLPVEENAQGIGSALLQILNLLEE